MYLVERKPGQQALYRSPDELAAAIQRGEVDSDARIFHRASSTWLPITVHPAYRDRMGAPRVETDRPRQPPPRKQWTFLQADPEATSEEPAQSSAADAAAGASAESPSAALGQKPRRRLRFWR
jgi:hypothetical protein